ncbi:MAG: RNA polymerase sigma factor [Proteobacteria bacterium]|nr:RNA polymerase sigma factor [Pseudomonadota bacterium]
MEDFDDNSLMREIQNGNRGAFSILVERHSKYFFAIAYRFLNNRETAEDILQTAFLKLWERPYKFDCDGAAGFKTWFAKCVVNLCLDDRRARRPVGDIDDYEIADDRTDVSGTAEKRREYIALENAVRSLSPPMRTVVTLGLIQDMKYEDVGKIMKKSTGAVKVMISRAKEKLTTMMKEQGYDGME